MNAPAAVQENSSWWKSWLILITRLKDAFALFEISNVCAQKMCKMIFVTFQNFAPVIYRQLSFKI